MNWIYIGSKKKSKRVCVSTKSGSFVVKWRLPGLSICRMIYWWQLVVLHVSADFQVEKSHVRHIQGNNSIKSRCDRSRYHHHHHLSMVLRWKLRHEMPRISWQTGFPSAELYRTFRHWHLTKTTRMTSQVALHGIATALPGKMRVSPLWSSLCRCVFGKIKICANAVWAQT